MTIEAPGPTPHEMQRLEALLLTTLSEHDELCLDDEEERRQLAAILARVLVTTDREEAESKA